MPDDLKARVIRLEERSQADRDARAIAAKEIDRRLLGMNELREQLTSERGRYVERETYEERHQLLIAGQTALDNRMTRLEATGLANKRATVYMIGVATLVISLVVAVANVLAR